jgi:hypothetical protein
MKTTLGVLFVKLFSGTSLSSLGLSTHVIEFEIRMHVINTWEAEGKTNRNPNYN